VITQPNKPLSLAVLRTRNGEIPGFEDFYLLTCENTLADIRAAVSNEDQVWEIFRGVYTEVWRRRDSIPETGIVRSWLRVLIRDQAKRVTGTVIEEFPAETSSEPLKDVSDKCGSALIRIEEDMGLLTLPDAITGRRIPKSLPSSVLRFLLAIAVVAAAAFAVIFLVKAIGRSAADLTPIEETTEAEIVVEAGSTEEETTAPVTVFGWNETPEGLRYRQEDGDFAAECWLEDGEHLYYLDGDGYAVTGSRQFGVQNFVFGDDGALKAITRSYSRERSETVLSVQMEAYGNDKQASFIIDDSITLDGGWIYYLLDQENGNGLPMLLRVRRDDDDTEMIDENVAGYTVQADYVWYYSGNEIRHFAKGEEGEAVTGEGWRVEESDGSWYLRDSFGRNAQGSGGYETISGRVYRVDDGRIRSVRPGTQKIDGYTFTAAAAGSSNKIMLGDGREYLAQGQAIDSLATFGESLYYSVLLTGDGKGASQIWRVDIYTGEASAVTSAFTGRVRQMYTFPEAGAVYMEYHPGGGAYGQIAAMTGGKVYVVNDGSARSAAGFGNGNDLLSPVWAEDGKLYCYWYNTNGKSGSDGSYSATDTRTLVLSASDLGGLPGAAGSSPGPGFFGSSPAAAAEQQISEDEMVEAQSTKPSETIEAVPGETAGNGPGPQPAETMAPSAGAPETAAPEADDADVEGGDEDEDDEDGEEPEIDSDDDLPDGTVAPPPEMTEAPAQGQTFETVAPVPGGAGQ